MSLAQEPTPENVTKATASSDEAPTSGARSSLSATLATLKAAQRKQGAPSYEKRIAHLDALRKALVSRKEEIARAISADDEPFAAEVQGLRGPRRVRAYLVDVTRRERLAA